MDKILINKTASGSLDENAKRRMEKVMNKNVSDSKDLMEKSRAKQKIEKKSEVVVGENNSAQAEVAVKVQDVPVNVDVQKTQGNTATQEKSTSQKTQGKSRIQSEQVSQKKQKDLKPQERPKIQKFHNEQKTEKQNKPVKVASKSQDGAIREQSAQGVSGIGDARDDVVAVQVGRGVSGNTVSRGIQASSANKTSRLINITEHDGASEKKVELKDGHSVKSATRSSVKVTPLVLGSGRDTETELISEDADVLIEDENEGGRSDEKGLGYTGRPQARPRPLAGLSMDVKSSSMMHRRNHFTTEHEEKTEEAAPVALGEPRFSKPKATLIAVGVALLVGVIGGLIVWLTNRPATQYCLVQFESNGGSEVESSEIVCGNLVEQPNNPSKEGFDFQGWVYANEPFDFTSRTIDEDMILVAKWQVQEGVETVTVKFDSDGGSKVHEQKIAKGKKASAPVGVTRDGYDLVGWYLGDTKFDFAKTAVEKDLTLKARWERAKEQNTNQNNRNNNSSSSRPGNNSSSNNSNGGPSDNSKPSTTVTGIFVASQKMTQGDIARIDVSISPATAKYKLVTVSTNNAVATCAVTSANHLECSAVGEGTATITVRDNDSNRSASFEITVEPMRSTEPEQPEQPDITPVETIAINGNPETMKVGDTARLSAIVLPENATNRNVSWLSNNSGVITIDGNGNIAAVGVGQAEITAIAGGKNVSVVITVTENSGTGESPDIPGTGGGETPNPPEDGSETTE